MVINYHTLSYTTANQVAHLCSPGPPDADHATRVSTDSGQATSEVANGLPACVTHEHTAWLPAPRRP